MGTRAGSLQQSKEVEAGLFLVRSSPRSYSLSDGALRERVVRALELGAQAAASLRERWPGALAEEVARALGLRVVEKGSSAEGTSATRLRLAEFRPGQGITLYRDGVKQVAAVLEPLLPDSQTEALARQLLVAHELFHGLLELPRNERPGALQRAHCTLARQLGYPARFLGIPFLAAIPELEEVAAHSFSTAWTRLAVPALLVHARVAARYQPGWARWLATHPEPALSEEEASRGGVRAEL